MKLNVAINGFGRIGRLAFRNFLNDPNVEIVGINDLTDVNTLAHLLKYDSMQGSFPGSVEVVGNGLKINEDLQIPVSAVRDPENLPWEELGVDVVLESTI